MFLRLVVLRTAALKPVERTVKNSKLFRPLVARFIAGNSLREAMAVCENLLERGFYATLDYLGENTTSQEEALTAKSIYIEMLDEIGARVTTRFAPEGYRDGAVEPLNISIKLTQCGLDQGAEFAEANLREVVARARDLGNFVRVDMEASPYADRTVFLVERVHADLPNVGVAVQSYLYRSNDDVGIAILKGIRVRMVKGAYVEDSDVAYQRKERVDECYVSLSKALLENGVYPAIATHDEAIIREIEQFAASHGIEKQRFEFQMLYGIRRDLQAELLAKGYRVRVYVPFGGSWYPYFTRRLAERPANMMFLLKSLFKG